jgi:serine/threonine-protein kinase
MTDAALLPSGLVVGGDFTIERPLGEGGMGAVYLAKQASTGKHRALKVMHREIAADPALAKRFEQEAKVGAKIASEHVVEPIAAGVDAHTGLPYLVMELLEGEDLRRRLRKGPLPRSEIRVVFEQLCHAMAAAHAGGIIHRDLKPENVFLARARRAGSDPFEVKVLDFGIAKITAEAGTRATKGAVGSPLWMAPEQTTPAPVGPPADVWAIGLLAFELFTGKSFWRAANADGATTAMLLREVVLDPIPPATERANDLGVAARLPEGFDAWFARCLAREPAYRFADAGAAWRAMGPLFGIETEAFAETSVASETGAAMPYASAPRGASSPRPAAVISVAPPMTSGIAPETPVASVRDKTPAPTPQSNRMVLVAGVAIAIAGIAVGWGLSQRAPQPVANASPNANANANPSANANANPNPSVSAVPSNGAGASSPSSVAGAAGGSSNLAAAPSSMASSAAPRASASAVASAKPVARTVGGGFSDPVDRNGAVTWKVGEKHVRLFTRLVSNESNVADSVVRKAIEWNSWEYLRCYERVSGLKDLPEGVVTVGFDILDQLPRHGKLVSSTIASDTFNDCVVRTLIGQTINAAGPDGKGHATMAFRFVPND